MSGCRTYLIWVQTKLFDHSNGLGSKSFIDLKQVNLLQLPTSFLNLVQKRRMKTALSNWLLKPQ